MVYSRNEPLRKVVHHSAFGYYGAFPIHNFKNLYNGTPPKEAVMVLQQYTLKLEGALQNSLCQNETLSLLLTPIQLETKPDCEVFGLKLLSPFFLTQPALNYSCTHAP